MSQTNQGVNFLSSHVKKDTKKTEEDEYEVKESDVKLNIQTNVNSNESKKEVELEDEGFVLDRFPCNIEKAKKHARAKRVRKPLSVQDSKLDPSQICECCGYRESNQQLGFCDDLNELGFLGPGIPLYFQFIKGCICLLFITICIFGITNTVFNLQGDACKDEEITGQVCELNYISMFSFANKKNDMDKAKIQSIMNFATVFCLILGIHVYRRQNKREELELDASLVSPSDFAAELSNLPPNVTQARIIDMLEIWWNNFKKKTEQEKQMNFRKDVIKDIAIAYDLTEFYQHMEKKNHLELKIRQTKYYFNKKNEYPKDMNQEKLQEMIKEANSLKQKINDLSEKAEKEDGSIATANVAFVSFSEQNILDQFDNNLKQGWVIMLLKRLQFTFLRIRPSGVLIMDNYIVKADRAPEPSDIKWENCGAKNKFLKRFLTYFVTFVLLGCCFGIIFLLNKVQYDSNEKNQDKIDITSRVIQYILSICVSFVVVFINGCLTIFIKRFSAKESRSTETHLNVSIAEKLTIAQFTNTALLTLAANFIISVDDVWSDNGLIVDIFYIAIVQAVLFPFNNYFSIFKLLRMWKRYKIKTTREKEGESCVITQGEANFWFEGNPLELYGKYAHILKMMWMTGFYSPLLPLLQIITVFALCLTYWVDKLLLFKRYARLPLLSRDLNKQMIELLEYYPLSLSIGNIFFQNIINDGYNVSGYDIASIVLSAINFIIPSSSINRLICKVDTSDLVEDNLNYDQARFEFLNDYDRANPITAQKAMRDWTEYLLKNGDENQKKKAQQMKNNQNSRHLQSILGNFGRGYQAPAMMPGTRPNNPLQNFVFNKVPNNPLQNIMGGNNQQMPQNQMQMQAMSQYQIQ
ncbi:hypothetical protein PPERSA_04638 [Pseudocohnilembus persalinus]|uniref:CSC1/OSCA1-like cytosolic domain-containing protein n=1 Tax=Pseudocohnilembus persalinus TaxID=266149 RepID=A0A0V0QNB3_PSEPJ|nr:hypothetical protein PPERSA_04638 [Pseudocohnilembus persalinus]|eukprot:KRX03843.1 hypothetical protein PPERSA_04638 [Pseudocohnilembus persalinus]